MDFVAKAIHPYFHLLMFAREIQTDNIGEAEASQKSKFASKRKTSSTKQKHKRTFKENRVSPECNQVDPPPAATTEDAAASEEGYEGPWKLRSLAPINFSRVTPSVNEKHDPTSRNGKRAPRDVQFGDIYFYSLAWGELSKAH